MPVITVATSKGGAGKTTLNLALASEFSALGGSVIILDADRQRSVLNWQKDRSKDSQLQNSLIEVRDVSHLRDTEIAKEIETAKSQATLVLVDSEGTSNMKTMYAAKASDFVVIPTKSSLLDLERAVETIEMVRSFCPGVEYKVLLTQMQSAARSSDEIEIDNQIISEYPTFEDRMFQLAAYRKMTDFRMTLQEITMQDEKKAARARLIAQSILRSILVSIKEKADA